MEPAEPAAVESAESTAMESPPATAKCSGALGPDGDAYGDSRAEQQRTSQPLPVVETLDQGFLPECYLVEVIAWNSTFDVPDGSAGVNTGAAMRGAKFQSVNTALNCGCARRVL
jgi:hypothetical protein